MITTKPKKKVITVHIHGTIARLAEAAIERGDIINCKKVTANSYFIKHLRPGQQRPQTEKFTTVGAASLLYLLNVKAKGQNQIAEPEQPELDSESYFSVEPGLNPELNPELEPELELEPDFELEQLSFGQEAELETRNII